MIYVIKDGKASAQVCLGVYQVISKSFNVEPDEKMSQQINNDLHQYFMNNGYESDAIDFEVIVTEQNIQILPYNLYTGLCIAGISCRLSELTSDNEFVKGKYIYKYNNATFQISPNPEFEKKA